MTLTDRLIEQLDRAHHGEPWHGSPLQALVADLTPAQAAGHPVPGAHSVLELVLHMAGWKHEVVARLRGAPAGTPPQGDWPAVPPDTERAWRDALDALDSAHRELRDEVRRQGDEGLNRPTRDTRPGVVTPDTGFEAAIGILQHDVYHMGQIGLLKRALHD